MFLSCKLQIGATATATTFPLTMMTYHLPRGLYGDILKVVVTAFLVFLQRTALFVASSTVVTFMRFTYCEGKKVLYVKSVLLTSLPMVT